MGGEASSSVKNRPLASPIAIRAVQTARLVPPLPSPPAAAAALLDVDGGASDVDMDRRVARGEREDMV